jgi:hypothetical protein
LDDYLCITILSRPGETQEAFAGRLSAFWTHMLRDNKDDFEKVYAETTSFERHGEKWGRQYLMMQEVADLVEKELHAAGLDHEPIDHDDVYSKYEATPPEWMQIEH